MPRTPKRGANNGANRRFATQQSLDGYPMSGDFDTPGVYNFDTGVYSVNYGNVQLSDRDSQQYKAALSWFVDDLMRHLGQPYYVSLLSAAALHGAAHQQPMVFQVVTATPTRAVHTGRVTIGFWMAGNAERMPAAELQTETGIMRVATPETAAFDLLEEVVTDEKPLRAAEILGRPSDMRLSIS